MTTPSAPSAPADNRSRLLRALAYYAAYVTLGLSVAALGPTLPALAEQTGSDLSQISIIFMANALGYMLGTQVGGRLYDRVPGHPVLAAMLLSMAVLLVAVPLAPSRWLLGLVLALVGVGMGALDVGGNTLIVWLFGRDVGPYMNALHFSFGLGAFLSPLMIDRIVVLGGGIRWAYWLLALLIALAALWMTRLPSPSRQEAATGPEAAARKAGFGWLTVLIAGLMFLHLGAELGYGNWIFSYGLAVDVGPETTARLLNSVFWGALTLGRLIAIPVAAWLLPRTMLLIDLIGAAISMGVILLLPGWAPAVWIGTFGFGLSLASFFASAFNFAERRMPITGRVTGYILVVANAGSMTIPWLIGQLFESVGPQAMMSTIGLTVVVSLALFAVTLAYAARMPARAALGAEPDPA